MNHPFKFLVYLLLLLPPWVCAELSVSSRSGEEVWRLDCGTENLPPFPQDTTAHPSDSDGNLWLQDELFSANYRWGYDHGQRASSSQVIVGSSRTFVYQTHRYGQTTMGYRLRLPNGLYQVKLLFAETTHTMAGARVFDVAVEGIPVLDDHDVFAHVGADTADDHVFGAVVTDEQLDITFPEVKADNAMIAGIEVKAVDVSDDSLLDFLEKRMYYYFANHTSLTTGLTPVSLVNWMPETYDEGGLAVSGLGMSVMAVAASRGWISAGEAMDRIKHTLATIEPPSARVRGFPYDRYVRDTGAVRAGAEVSSLESALFIVGAIQAGEYFRDADPTILQRIINLDGGMEWTWWLNRARAGIDDSGNNLAIAKSWRPTGDADFVIPSADPAGFFRAEWWEDYSETLLVDLAAVGAPTVPVPASVFLNMGRPWLSLFNEDVLHAPALSQNQYPHLFFDLRSRQDSYGIDYFEMARRATEVNRRACLADPSGRYSPDRWGLSGAYGPGDVYRLYGPEPNPNGVPDGTVDPNAALLSLPLTPTESMAAVRHMFFQYKHHILGRHGFCDGFNVSQEYRAGRGDGLDYAAAILAIENYRTGMPRARFMASAHAQAALSAIGMNGGPSVHHASTALQPPSFAFDNNPATAWESAEYDPQWLRVFLGSERTISRVRLEWTEARPRRYKIQVSQDGEQWMTAAEQSGGSGAVLETLRFDPVQARYVRFYGEDRAGAAYVLREMIADTDGDTGVKAFPNPFRPSQGHRAVTISGLLPGARVNLYTFSGVPVRSLAADAYGSAQWDGTTTSGDSVPSDVYIARVDNTTQTLTLVVQR
ncbi:MAG: discoidin domain-containing protein [Elusimicrobia bacterium]|nr:discoidin domain-containing protein [Elusimicrobiota bacterium]